MQSGITPNPTEPLDAQKHNRAEFSCGVGELDVFLQQKARKESPEFSRTFVITDKEQPSEILGYYSLSATHLRADDLPDAVRKKLPRYEALPATLLGRLAVAQKYQKSALRLGELLLVDAQLRAWRAAQEVASYGLIVKVLVSEKGDPTTFYERYGFIACASTMGLMYLPLRTIEAALKSASLI